MLIIIEQIDLTSSSKIDQQTEGEDQCSHGSDGSLDFFEQLKLRCNKSKTGDSDSSSCFSASSESQNAYRSEKLQPVNYLPVFRKEHGGILIYDCEATVPNQPIPNQNIQIDVSTSILIHRRLKDIRWLK